MKKIPLLLFILGVSLHSFSQTDSTAPYWKERTMPAFSLLDKDSIPFTQNILAADKNIIIMLFNPECDHCQKQLELLLSIPEVANSAELVLSSIETIEKNNIFYKKFHLENYPFVHLGKDYKYLFGKYFRPTTIPVLAFYNKKKEFVLINQGNAAKKVIVKALEN
jgi:thiol-disulfide isomerase/thioredoxin